MGSRFILTETPIKGLFVAERKIDEDTRGSFGKLFCAREFLAAGISKPVVQINHSLNLKKGTLRGLHFQHPPHSETRVVSCLRGEVFDVAVDLRRGSGTFLTWHGEKLSPENRRSLIVPEGFAHGFQTLADNCELVYFHTGFYVPEAEDGFNAGDKKIGIKWPLPAVCLSGRDKGLPFLSDGFRGIVL